MSRRLALISGISLALSSGGVWAAQFGSPAWFAAQNKAVPVQNVQAPATNAPSGDLAGRVVTPDQALVRAQRSVQNLSRAAEIIASAQSAQNAARQLALSGASPVSNGLLAGGLQVAAGVGTDPSLWQNAALPTQTTEGSQTIVTVEQEAAKAILTWDSFNVGRETTLHFDQTRGTQSDGSNAWIALNRVLDTQAAPSQILGKIEAEGSVYVINRNGIVFGGASQVNTHSFLASSLSLFSTDLATSNDIFRNSGLNDYPRRDPSNFALVGDLAGGLPPGDIEIQAGARITTGRNGYSFIAAPNVRNAGTILVEDGQAILTAGLGVRLLDFHSSSALADVTKNLWLPAVAVPNDLVRADALGTLENTGLIGASRGNVSLVAYEVNQAGVVQATTSVSRPGSLYIAAQDPYQPPQGSTPAQGGILNLASGSLTAILPERDGETTTSSAAADLTFAPPAAILAGTQVTLREDALVLAPGATVDVLGWGRVGGSADAPPEYIEIGARAAIDVAGLADVQLAMSANQVTIPRVGLNELANSPLQRDGLLYTQEVTVDGRVSGTRGDGLAWFGSPLLNIGGYVENRPRRIDQLLTDGGTIDIVGRQLITRPGSLLNVSGGYVRFLAGRVETTRLLGADGRIYDISQADPNMLYSGIAGQHTRDFSRWNVSRTYTDPLLSGKFGHYETDYIVGGSGGALNLVMGGVTLLGGEISAQTVSGRYQIDQARPSEGSRFSFGLDGTLATRAFENLQGLGFGNHVRVTAERIELADGLDPANLATSLPQAGLAPTDPDNPLYWTSLSAPQLNDAGFSHVDLGTAGREVLVQEGAALTVQNGGSIDLHGARVEIYGALTARAGGISASASGLWDSGSALSVPIDEASGLAARGDVIVGGHARLDARGEFVNDAFLGIDEQSGAAWIDGGSIALRTQTLEAVTSAGTRDWTGAITLQQGAVLDVSGGGYVGRDGQLAIHDGVPLGRGGDIALLTYLRHSVNGVSFWGYRYAPVDESVGRIDFAGADLRGESLGGGGTFSLRALDIQIGGDPQSAGPRTLHLSSNFFENQGFGSYDLSAELDATIVAGAQVRVSQRNLIPDVAALVQAPTGADVFGGEYGQLGALDVYYRPATNFSLRAGAYVGRAAGNPAPNLEGATGTMLLDAGASLLLDPGASVRLGSRNQLTVLGNVVARGGNIVLSGDSALDTGESPAPSEDLGHVDGYFSASRSVWLGANALLDVTGIALVDPLSTPIVTAEGQRTPRSGRVLDGGQVTLTNDTGYVVVESGARINLSGSADRFDLIESGAVGTVLTPQDVWSDAGVLALAAGAGLLFDGSIDARAGAPEAAGGTLVLRPVGSASANVRGAQGILFHQTGERVPEGLAPGDVVEAQLAQPSGVLHFAVDRLEGSGIETLIAGSNPNRRGDATPLPIGFAGAVSLSLERAIQLNASSYIALPEGAGNLTDAGEGGSVVLDAAYISLSGNHASGGSHTVATNFGAPGDARLSVEAGFIDLGGQFAFVNFGDAVLSSRGDIRFYTPVNSAYGERGTAPFTGQLFTAGNLSFSAAQLYPATNTAFAVVASGVVDPQTGQRAETHIAISSNGASSAAPLSAGGSLLLDATHIDQQGTIRAPSGQIVLGVDDPNDADTLAQFANLPLTATQSVRLGDGSITSVSLDGLIVPYGATVDQTNYVDASNPLFSDYPDLAAPPEKSIRISGAEVALDRGAVVDLQGGGELYAQEWIAGTGGSRDLLSRTNTVYSGNSRTEVPLYADGRAVYAIVPGQVNGIAPYDPAFDTGDVHIGQAVYLSGREGVPAGVYTLMPAQYATLPGAYRIVQDTSVTDFPAIQNATLPDGTMRVSGHFVDGITGEREARSSAFLLQARDVWGQYSEYAITGTDAFFAGRSASEGTALPQLARDAGRLTLAATRSLELGVTLSTAAGEGGAGAQVDIASERIQIVGSGAPALDGYLQLAAADLNALGAASLLIGGGRSQNAEGVTIDAKTSSLVVSNDSSSALRAPEILLVTNGGSSAAGDGLSLEAGSAIRAEGQIAPGTSVPIMIGRDDDAANGITAVRGDGALLRVSNGAPVLVHRHNVSGTGGLLQIGAGAELSGGAALSLDATADTRLDPTALLSATAIDANSSLVSFVADAADGAGRSGLVIGPQTLALFDNAERVTLRSRGDMAFVGATDVALANADLSLSAGRFVGDGSTVHLGARTVTLSNELNGSASQSPSAGSGTLRVDAGMLEFGAGEALFAGFNNVELSATQRITGSGTGKASFGEAALTLTAPAFVAGGAADTTLVTTGAMRLLAGPGTLTGELPAGGALALIGGSIESNARLVAPAGRISLRATQGDVSLEQGASIDVSGFAKEFFDVTRYAPGGAIALTADAGNVRVAADSALDFSGADRGGDAGSLSVSAARGSVQLDGLLRGDALAGETGGAFNLDSGSALQLDALADLLLAGGIDGAIAVRSRSGNLELSAGKTLAAHSVRLVADGGAGGSGSSDGHVVIAGTIDASGAKGGDIELYGKSGVEVQGTLLATGSSADERGGNVRLYTTGVTDGSYNAAYGYQNVTHDGSGRIVLGASSVIDVSGGSAGGLSGGTVQIRAPLLDDGDVNVEIDQSARLQGAREVGLEAYAVWSTTDATSGTQHFDGFIDPAGWYDSAGNLLPGTFTDHLGNVVSGEGDPSRHYFTPTTANADHVGFYQDTLANFVQQPGFTFEDRFAHVANFSARPGIELRNPSAAINDGKISVLTNWNLGARDASGNFIYRYGSAAPVLTVRAQNDVEVKANINDGFYQYSNDGLSPSPVTTPEDAQEAYLANGLGTSFVNGARFAVFLPETFTAGTPEEQSLYYEMYRAYASIFSVAQYGNTQNRRLSVAAQAANFRGYVVGTGPDPANPEPTPPANLQDYAAYLQAYVAYARVALQSWTGTTFAMPVPYIVAPAPPPLQLASGSSNAVQSGNTPSPFASIYDQVPVHTASLIGGGASYRFAAGAEWDSSDPLALRGDDESGDIAITGHTTYIDSVSGRDVLLPTLVRTGTGTIELAANRDIKLDDALAPGVIYSGGRPAQGTATGTESGRVSASSGLVPTYAAALLTTGSVNPEAAGDIRLTAGRDVIGNREICDVDGSISGIAGLYLGQSWWQWMQTANTPTASSINFGAFGQGVMSIGGDVSVSAGRDIRELSVSLPTTWTLTGTSGAQELKIYGGGDLDVSAGRDVLSGDYFVSKGEGLLSAGGRIGSGFTLATRYLSGAGPRPISTSVAPILGLQDAAWEVVAGQGADIGGIYNPSYVRKITGFFSSADSQQYSSDSSVSVAATAGDVALGTMRLPGALFTYGSNIFDASGVLTVGTLVFEDVLPASLDAVALNGSVSVESAGLMVPSASGSLNLIAAGDLRLFNRRAVQEPEHSVLRMGDFDADRFLPSPMQQIGVSLFPDLLVVVAPGDELTRTRLLNLHRNDREPARLYALEGDIVGGFIGDADVAFNALTLQIPKTAQVLAGRDIVDLDFRGQNYLRSDVTRIAAGRDLYYTVPNPQMAEPFLGYQSKPGLHLEIAGPGTLDVEAGRNLGPLSSVPRSNTGIRSIGNANNAGLPYEGADIRVRFGVAPGIATDAFAARFLDPSRHVDGMPGYDAELIAFMREYFADHPDAAPAQEPTVDAAWAAFQQLPTYRQQLLVDQVLVDVLKRVGLDYNDPESVHFEQYARGYEAINTLFPAELGYTANSFEGGDNGAEAPVTTGNLDMRGSTIQTRRGGDISIVGPGGRLTVGSTSAPPVIVDALGRVLVGPSEQGILTMERGSIGIFADRSVLLAQSRVFTERGGDILMWSSNGDINAGKGAKTSSEIAPVSYECDNDRYCRINAAGLVTGAGIATLQTLPDSEPGNAVLVAPRGTVDAGDAGIRVSGNLFVAAFSIANADNIQVQGETVGVPSVATNVGALSAASSATAAAQKSADDLANQRPAARAASMISVEVVGLGRPSEEQKKQLQRKQ